MLIEIEGHNNFPENLGYLTFIKYFPTRFEVNQNYRDNRTAVYRFKDGIYDIGVDTAFIHAIKGFMEIKKFPTYWLCVIPSSKVQKTQTRFKSVCQRICAANKINNGFDLLKSIEDRNEVHIGGNRNYEHVLESIQFGDIAGKHILLIDDVVTLGKSYRIIANHLMKLGAISVNGFMLAKTHWLNEDEGIVF